MHKYQLGEQICIYMCTCAGMKARWLIQVLMNISLTS